MLEVRGLKSGYGRVEVLHGLDLSAAAGEVLCIMGRNGAGKSTALKTIMGLVPVAGGEVALGGTRLDTLPAHSIPARGIGYVPQGRRLFAELTVAENLEIGLMVRNRGKAVREQILDLFPRLRERLGQVSGSLSGGEQQMLAVARALCIEPSVLLLDEPTEGLQPSMIALIQETVKQLRADGVAVVLVEQRVDAALGLADRISFVVNGRTAETVDAGGLHAGSAQFVRYVGV